MLMDGTISEEDLRVVVLGALEAAILDTADEGRGRAESLSTATCAIIFGSRWYNPRNLGSDYTTRSAKQGEAA